MIYIFKVSVYTFSTWYIWIGPSTVNSTHLGIHADKIKWPSSAACPLWSYSIYAHFMPHFLQCVLPHNVPDIFCSSALMVPQMHKHLVLLAPMGITLSPCSVSPMTHLLTTHLLCLLLWLSAWRRACRGSTRSGLCDHAGFGRHTVSSVTRHGNVTTFEEHY